jgi:GAF domain-containing protein
VSNLDSQPDPKLIVPDRELEAAREQQAATAAILTALANVPVDLSSVLKAVAENAGRLCEAYDATILLRAENVLKPAVHSGPIPILLNDEPLSTDLVTWRAVLEGAPIHISDLATAGDEYPKSHRIALERGYRSILAMPLLRQGTAIGVLVIRRTEPRSFSPRQVELLKTFADQAMIAIETVRLSEEAQARNRELVQSLDQQTATNEVLRVISSSLTNVQPVFDRIAESAARLCEAKLCFVYRFDGSLLHLVAHHGLTPAGAEATRLAFLWRLEGRALGPALS